MAGEGGGKGEGGEGTIKMDQVGSSHHVHSNPTQLLTSGKTVGTENCAQKQLRFNPRYFLAKAKDGSLCTAAL